MNEERKIIPSEAEESSDAEPKYSDAAYSPVGNEQPNYIYSPSHSYGDPAAVGKNKERSLPLSMVLICLICALLAFLLGVSSTLLFSKKIDNNTEARSILPAEASETESETAEEYSSDRASMGIGFGTVSASAAQYFDIVEGAMVQVVKPGGCADDVGLLMGDIITVADGTDISDAGTLKGVIMSHKPGDTVAITVFRNREYLNFNLVLDEAFPIGGNAASSEPSGEMGSSNSTASSEISTD